MLARDQPQIAQKLSSRSSPGLRFVARSYHCLLISLDPAAHLHMELHYSCGAWHLISSLPEPVGQPDRQTGARDHRVHSAQRESCHYGRLIDRVKANENTWNPIWKRGASRRGNRSRPVRGPRPSAPLARSKRRRRNQILSGRPFSVLMSTIDGRTDGAAASRLARLRVVIPQ